jgi:hypothetical protein
VIRFDPYAVEPPGGSFDYIVDDLRIRRTPRGSPRLLHVSHSALRLSPDSEYRSWRNEYVMVREESSASYDRESVTVLRVRGSVFLHQRGLGADVLDFEATVFDPAREGVISVGAGGADRAAVERKVLKVLDWYRSELQLRDSGERPLLTATELWFGDDWTRRAS